MAAQYLLFDEPAAPVPIHFLFFAAMPVPPFARYFRQFGRGICVRHGHEAVPVSDDRLHVTVRPLGHFRHPEEYIQLGKRIGDAVAMWSFMAAFDRLVTLGDRKHRRTRPVVLCGSEGVYGFTKLRQAIEMAMVKVGVVFRDRRDFLPHMTLLYNAAEVDEQPIEAIDWPVREFVLIHSWQGLHRHDLVGRWALGG